MDQSAEMDAFDQLRGKFHFLGYGGRQLRHPALMACRVGIALFQRGGNSADGILQRQA